jgi:threonyl-tRNA synthetase
VEVDDSKEKVNNKIRLAQVNKIPFMLVVGDREAQEGKVSVRNRRHGDQGAQTVPEFLDRIKNLADNKIPSE